MEVLQTLFPKDIAQLIYSQTVRIEHREKFQYCFQQIHLYGLLASLKHLGTTLDYWEVCPDLEYSLSVLNTCTCCDRHQERRPNMHLRPSDYRAEFFVAPKTKAVGECSCPCRHHSRNIVKVHTYGDDEWEQDNRFTLYTQFLLEYTERQKSLAELEIWTKKKSEIQKELYSSENYHEKQLQYYEALDCIEIHESKIDNLDYSIQRIAYMIKEHRETFSDVHTSIDNMIESFM
jgi:hypothetical protein